MLSNFILRVIQHMDYQSITYEGLLSKRDDQVIADSLAVDLGVKSKLSLHVEFKKLSLVVLLEKTQHFGSC
jgi:hypothetical protein